MLGAVIRSGNHSLPTRGVKPKAPREASWLKAVVSQFPEGESDTAKPCEWAWMPCLPMPELSSML